MADRNENPLDEYDFANGVRGKYADRFAQGTNIVCLDEDVARIFPDSAAVNRALRTLAETARRVANSAIVPPAE